MKRIMVLSAGLLLSGVALAHVQIMVISEETVSGQKGAVRDIDIQFADHAMEIGPLLSMDRPKTCGVLVNGRKHDLRDALVARQEAGKNAFSCTYSVTEPGAHVMYLEPAPYWDPSEEVVVTHYAKVIFNSCGAGLKTKSAMGWENWEGWDAQVGFPVEIEPLVQCTSLWTGAEFRGVVRNEKGKPFPSCRIEVEYYNKDGAVAVPDASFITQILKTDKNGVFSFVPVRAGWWGLTALPEMDKRVKGPQGNLVEAEIGGALWIHAVDVTLRP